ncbi:aminotransferase class I/II-fold pyridoxal phosphate-dependent enzyme [Actinokineospora auranticolor]|nr:aminotransferase class I/II-fold pyridoxal phosphate-dependent enzyme [Actinokineospora auranticolor]
MTELANRTGAVNLGQGFPDSDGPPELLAAARDAIAAGHNQYPPVSGVPVLRAAVAEDRAARYGTEYDPARDIVVTTGATAGIAAAVLAHCEPGDGVLVFEPGYDSYAANIAMAGGVARPVRLDPGPSGFSFDPADLRAATGRGTRLLIFNSPHNPTGKVFTDAELALIAEHCVAHDLIVITDEVHEHLVFDGRKSRSLAEWPGMPERTLVVSGAGKTFSVTGWKVGWVCGPADLVDPVRTAHQYLTFNSGTAFQVAVAHGLRELGPWVDGLRADLQDRRDLLAAGLAGVGLDVLPSEGTYFLQTDIRSWGHTDDLAFCRDLAPRGVVAVPTSVFYLGEPLRTLARFTFCKRVEVLTAAIEALRADTARRR